MNGSLQTLFMLKICSSVKEFEQLYTRVQTHHKDITIPQEYSILPQHSEGLKVKQVIQKKLSSATCILGKVCKSQRLKARFAKELKAGFQQWCTPLKFKWVFP